MSPRIRRTSSGFIQSAPTLTPMSAEAIAALHLVPADFKPARPPPLNFRETRGSAGRARPARACRKSGAAPLFAGMEVDVAPRGVSFAHASGGLMAQPDEIADLPAGLPASPVLGFVIAGEARIDGETVVVSSPDVPRPVAVRYNWANHPFGNLFSKTSELPAGPFRSDTWLE